jgi:tRNA (cmo5U34)-methyltransferase
MTERATDRLFEDEWDGAFRFDERVAEVFDDMVERSVPSYRLQQRLIGDLAQRLWRPGTAIYDLGCATGTTLAVLRSCLGPDTPLVGIDASNAMIARARAKLGNEQVELRCADLGDPAFRLAPRSASFVTLCWTLQFLPPHRRPDLLRTVLQALAPGGALVLAEKIRHPDPWLEALWVDLHEAMKRRHGYSDQEIIRKREALETVLVPDTLDNHHRLLREAGFATVDAFFRQTNFATLLALAPG